MNARSIDTPTLVDRGFQLAYRGAYQVMRVYWGVRRPQTHGALVALWNEGEILLVKNSYVKYHCLPGGYVRSGETSRKAALRELAEEVGVVARDESLDLVYDATHDWEGKRDHVEIFSLTVEERPAIRVDHREVVGAGWYRPERALSLPLFPPIRDVIAARR